MMDALSLALSALESSREWIRQDLENLDREEFKITMGLRSGGQAMLKQIDAALDALREEMLP